MSGASKNLESLAVLEDGWDIYGGKKPTDTALKTASEIFYVPLPDGGVQLPYPPDRCVAFVQQCEQRGDVVVRLLLHRAANVVDRAHLDFLQVA